MFLSVVACFRNESHILEEWIEHYLDEGVDQFLLCANKNDDDYKHITGRYDNVIVYTDDSESIQLECKPPHNKYGTNIYSKMIYENEGEWFIIVDVDEFMYSRGKYKTIKDLLKERGAEFNQLIVPNPTFHNKFPNEIITQPESVIDSFTQSSHQRSVKSIVRKSSLVKCRLHEHRVTGRTTSSNLKDDYDLISDWTQSKFEEWRTYPTGESFIHCNHYRYQSKDYFFKVKANRGYADRTDNLISAQNRLGEWQRANTQQYNNDFELKDKKKMYKRK